MSKSVKLPVIYEEAIRDLIACQTLDETQYFVDKAEALAAWAKIFKSNQAAIEAKRLKLHAYRRMGELAAELRPPYQMQTQKGVQGTGGSKPGPVSLLIEHGMTTQNAWSARQLARLPNKSFDKLVSAPIPPTINQFKNSRRTSSQSWQKISGGGPGSPMACRAFCRANSASSLARDLTVDESNSARKICLEIQEWFDEFEQHLPKELP